MLYRYNGWNIHYFEAHKTSSFSLTWGDTQLLISFFHSCARSLLSHSLEAPFGVFSPRALCCPSALRDSPAPACAPTHALEPWESSSTLHMELHSI